MDIKNEILKINLFLKKCLWMDFDYGIICDYYIELFGCIDQSFRDDAIKIKFVCPHYISTIFCFSKSDQLPFIELIEDPKLITEYAKMGLEDGDYIFKININDSDNPVIIVAQSIECEIFKNPFIKIQERDKRSGES